MYVTSETFLNGRLHAQVWQFWKSANISETDARGAKINPLPGFEREYIWEISLKPLSVAVSCPNMAIWKHPISRKPLSLEWK